jgi:hypothetical protein
MCVIYIVVKFFSSSGEFSSSTKQFSAAVPPYPMPTASVVQLNVTPLSFSFCIYFVNFCQTRAKFDENGFFSYSSMSVIGTSDCELDSCLTRLLLARHASLGSGPGMGGGGGGAGVRLFHGAGLDE